MVRKISFAILSIAILATGVLAFRKLNYWERSIRIFSFNSNAQFEGRNRFNRVEGQGERFMRPQMHELPDSIRARFESGRGRQGMQNRNIPDSLRQRFGSGERREGMGVRERNMPDSLRRQLVQEGRGRGDREPFAGGMRYGGGRGRDEVPGGRKINLRNVWWFLAIFASLAVIVIYLDKAYCFVFKRKKQQGRTNLVSLKTRDE